MTDSTKANPHEEIVSKAFSGEHGEELVGHLQKLNRYLSKRSQMLLGADGQLPSYSQILQAASKLSSRIPKGFTREELEASFAFVTGFIAPTNVAANFAKSPEILDHLQRVNRYLVGTGQTPIGLDGRLPSYDTVSTITDGLPHDSIRASNGSMIDRQELRVSLVQLESLLAKKEGIMPEPDRRRNLPMATISSRHARFAAPAPLAA